jgi:D-alanine transaminase
MPNIGVLNGEFLPLEEVRVSVEDRGFQFGDGVYEVIRVYKGKPFRMAEHLTRLERSAQAIQLPIDITPDWEKQIIRAIELSQYDQAKVYIQITRGIAPREHVFPVVFSPTVVITVREIAEVPSQLRKNGVSVITLPDIRWGRCAIKSLNLLPNILAKQQATEAKAFEAILIKNGFVTEGSSSNVMIYEGGLVKTPPLDDSILPGVTRQEIIEIAKTEGLRVQENMISQGELESANEVFLVGTTIEVLPVTTIDGKPVGPGVPGEVTNLLARKFEALIRQ